MKSRVSGISAAEGKKQRKGKRQKAKRSFPPGRPKDCPGTWEHKGVVSKGKKAESKSKAISRKVAEAQRKAKGRRQKAESKRQKAKSRSSDTNYTNCTNSKSKFKSDLPQNFPACASLR